MSESRPKVPEPIKRQLRKEAFFGCCKCGLPFVQYHHIRGYRVTGHVAEHMMILCNNCHDLCTVGALDETAQRKLKAMPFNRKQGNVSGLLYTQAGVILVEVGSNVLVGQGYKFVVDDEVLLSIRHGERLDMLISLQIYDAEETLQLLIVDNEWVTGDSSIADFEVKQRWLRLTSPFLETPLFIDARGPFMIIRGVLSYRGSGWRLTDERLSRNNVHFQGMAFFDQGFFARSDQLGMTIRPADGNGGMVAMEPAGTLADQARAVTAAYKKFRRGMGHPVPTSSE